MRDDNCLLRIVSYKVVTADKLGLK